MRPRTWSSSSTTKILPAESSGGGIFATSEDGTGMEHQNYALAMAAKSGFMALM